MLPKIAGWESPWLKDLATTANFCDVLMTTGITKYRPEATAQF